MIAWNTGGGLETWGSPCGGLGEGREQPPLPSPLPMPQLCVSRVTRVAAGWAHSAFLTGEQAPSSLPSFPMQAACIFSAAGPQNCLAFYFPPPASIVPYLHVCVLICVLLCCFPSPRPHAGCRTRRTVYCRGGKLWAARHRRASSSGMCAAAPASRRPGGDVRHRGGGRSTPHCHLRQIPLIRCCATACSARAGKYVSEPAMQGLAPAGGV